MAEANDDDGAVSNLVPAHVAPQPALVLGLAAGDGVRALGLEAVVGGLQVDAAVLVLAEDVRDVGRLAVEVDRIAARRRDELGRRPHALRVYNIGEDEKKCVSAVG